VIELKPDTQLTMAWTQSYREPWCSAYPVRVYDDCDGPLWIFGQEYGPTMVIRARSFETAWEIAVDESPTIEPEDVPEAHGYDGWCSGGYKRVMEVYSPETAKERFEFAVRAAQEEGSEHPDLLEGYEYQSNSSGTGIADVGHYVWLRELTADDLHDDRGLRIRVQRD